HGRCRRSLCEGDVDRLVERLPDRRSEILRLRRLDAEDRCPGPERGLDLVRASLAAECHDLQIAVERPSTANAREHLVGLAPQLDIEYEDVGLELLDR